METNLIPKLKKHNWQAHYASWAMKEQPLSNNNFLQLWVILNPEAKKSFLGHFLGLLRQTCVHMCVTKYS